MQNISRSLRSLWIVYKNEFRLFFASPIVYFIGGVWLFFCGIFFAYIFSYMNQGQAPVDMTFPLGQMIIILIFASPALTMRLVAGELRAGTHELLLTMPVREWEIIVGKWLAVWSVFSLYILVMLIYPLILFLTGNPEPGLIFTGYLGIWLLAGVTLAIGIFASAVTQYQAVSYMIGLGIQLFVLIAQPISQLVNVPFIQEFVTELSFSNHYRNLVNRAIIDPVDIAYFVIVTAVFLFLATQLLSTRRWAA